MRGLWFGLFDRVDADGSVRHTMYVAGTPGFVPDDDGDWACEYVWEATDRYLQLNGLAAIERDDRMAAVEHAVAVVTLVSPWETGPSVLQGAGVGFDDGDIRVVCTRA